MIDPIRDYRGTPKGFVELLKESLALYGGVRVSHEGEYFTVECVTGGWSDHEEVMGIVDKSFFSFCFWESIHRGGLFVYKIHDNQWDADFGALGRPA